MRSISQRLMELLARVSCNEWTANVFASCETLKRKGILLRRWFSIACHVALAAHLLLFSAVKPDNVDTSNHVIYVDDRGGLSNCMLFDGI